MSSTFSCLGADVVAFIRAVAEDPGPPRAARVGYSADSPAREDVARVMMSKAVAGIFIFLRRRIYRCGSDVAGGRVSRELASLMMPEVGALPPEALKHGSFPRLVASRPGEAHSPAVAIGDGWPCGAALAFLRSGRRRASGSPRRLFDPQKKTGKRQNSAACHLPPESICDPAVTK
jgi:hypothetical protein